MPNTKSAIRRVRRVKKQTSVNRVRKSKYKSAVKQMENLVKKGDKKKIKEFFPKFQSQNHKPPISQHSPRGRSGASGLHPPRKVNATRSNFSPNGQTATPIM